MSIRTIVEQGDSWLEKKCHAITSFNRRLDDLLDDLTDTLIESQGAGLAAPQIGILRRVCVVADIDNGGYIELVNPEIIFKEGEQTGIEGCLSIPGKWGIVTRPNHVRVRAQDRSGHTFEAEGYDLMARCFCHEIEHLDGHLYSEHIEHFMTQEEVDAYFAAQDSNEEEVKD